MLQVFEDIGSDRPQKSSESLPAAEKQRGPKSAAGFTVWNYEGEKKPMLSIRFSICA
jgi:hypothetical protein